MAMHELSIAQSIFEIIGDTIPADQATDVRSIRVRVGRLSGVVADSLQFCFSIIAADTPLRHAGLQIENVPAVSECRDCLNRFTVEDLAFLCPSCSSTNTSLVSGTELEVSEIELLDRPAEVT